MPRRARAVVPGTPDDAKKRLLQEALDAVRQSHEANTGDGPMHRWYGIILSEQRKYMSNKEQIVALYDIRDHFVQATEINPYDASAYHLLGQCTCGGRATAGGRSSGRVCVTRWSRCSGAYGIANLGFVLRQAAKVLFGTPPKVGRVAAFACCSCASCVCAVVFALVCLCSRARVQFVCIAI